MHKFTYTASICKYNFHIFPDVVDFGWQYKILKQIRSALPTLDSSQHIYSHTM